MPDNYLSPENLTFIYNHCVDTNGELNISALRNMLEFCNMDMAWADAIIGYHIQKTTLEPIDSWGW